MNILIAWLKNKNKLNVEIFFFLIALIGFFFILPPTLDYGDHASYGLIFQENLTRYLEQKDSYRGDFDDFVKEQYKAFHRDKLATYDALETYGLDKNVDLGWILNPNYYSVYIFSRLSTLGIFYLFLGKLNVEMAEMIFSFLVFVFTYIYAYKFGKLLVNRYFGITLAVVSISNVYFNQLVRSTMNPFNVVYPLLIFSSLYYLLLAHRVSKKIRLTPLIGLSVSLGLSFLNGYPSTNVLLIGLLVIAFFILTINIKIFKNKEYKLLPFYQYGKILSIAFLLILLVSALWSNLLGKSIFFGLNSILHDRIWGQILRGDIVSNELYKFELWQAPYIIKNTLQVLSIGSSALVGPHEPSFLLGMSFFNIIESMMFVLGTFFILRGIFSKRLENHLLFLFFVFFLYRLVGNSANYLVVGRYTYDFYFITVFFVAYGIYRLLNFSYRRTSKYRSVFLYVILFVSLLLNIKTFNMDFVWRYDENLRQMFGLYEVRELYRNEISKDNNLLIIDYNRSNGYLYHMDLISLLDKKIDYEIYGKFFNDSVINSLDSFKAYLRKSYYKNVYVVVPVGVSRWGGAVMFETVYNFHQNTAKFSNFFSPYSPYKTISNRRGIPKFWIYKFSNNHNYYTINLDEKAKDNYVIKFNGKERVDFLDFPGSVSDAEIQFGDKDILKLDFNSFSFDRFHFSFDEKSVIDIYNNFNFQEKISNIIESDIIIEPPEERDGVQINFLSPQKLPSQVVFAYQIGYPIKKVYYNVPFVFYNDQLLSNEFSVSYKTRKELPWNLLETKRSNGNTRYLDFDFYLMFGAYPRVYPHTYFNFFNMIYPEMEKNLYFQYKIASVYPLSVRPYSSYRLPDNTMNFLKFEVDTSEYRKFKELVNKEITLTLHFKKLQKEGTYQTLAVGTKL